MMKWNYLETPRLFLRPYRRSDAPAYTAVISQPEIQRSTCGLPEVPTNRSSRAWFRTLHRAADLWQHIEYGVFLKESGQYIGNVGLINLDMQHLHGDISYFIDARCQNCGYAAEAAEKMLFVGFELMGLEKIKGICFTDNAPSERVMQKLGMKPEGILRHEFKKGSVYRDVKLLSLLREEYFTIRKSGNPGSFQHQKVESVQNS